MLTTTIYRDNLPTVHITTWPMTSNLFDGEVAAGLVPTLFTSDPTATLAAITTEVIKAHADLAKVNKTITTYESVSVAEALLVLKKAR